MESKKNYRIKRKNVRYLLREVDNKKRREKEMKPHEAGENKGEIANVNRTRIDKNEGGGRIPSRGRRIANRSSPRRKRQRDIGARGS